MTRFLRGEAASRPPLQTSNLRDSSSRGGGLEAASPRGVFFLILAAIFCCVAPALAQQDLMRGTAPEGEVRIDQHLGRIIPRDLQFRDDSGRRVLLGEFFKEGKPVIITPVYYRCPMLCSVVLEGVVGALRELRFDVGKEFEVVTVSFDARETPADARERKEKYVRHYGRKGAAEGWHFLTGDQENVSALMHALGFRYQWDPKINQWAHGTTIVVATPDAKISRYFFGINYPPRDLRLGLVEAADRKIGTVADQLLLLCYHYDPASGKYSATAMNFVRLGGTATAAMLAGFIVIMLRRERRRPPA